MLPLPLLAAILAAGAIPSEDARASFLANCAACHGPEGAGDGTTKLDRPARSFQDGGFSYGNTEEALFRTITHGIPGTPMPSFAESLSDEERRALASYVVTLGPPVESVSAEETALVVKDVPLVVRGYLPPIAEGALSHPRGLLIGHPSGLTFEYRADDVRLLGVRQGGFVERKDWIGRGGAALEPLGKPVWVIEGGNPAPTFWIGDVPLAAKLRGTSLTEGTQTVAYILGRADDEVTNWAAESIEPARVPGAAGFVRTFTTRMETGGARARLHSWHGGELVTTFHSEPDPDTAHSVRNWFVIRTKSGHQAVGVQVPGEDVLSTEGSVLSCSVPHGLDWIVVTYLSLPAWNDDVRAQLLAQ